MQSVLDELITNAIDKMKTQSLLFSTSADHNRNGFLWSVAMRARRSEMRRPTAVCVGPVPENVIEWTPRHTAPVSED
jgi:hypothetical protein